MFGAKGKEIERLKRLVEVLEADIKKTAKQGNPEVDSLNKKVASLAGDVSELTEENAKLKKLVREQNTADILVNAFEAVGIIKTDEVKDHQETHGRLEGIRAQYQDEMWHRPIYIDKPSDLGGGLCSLGQLGSFGRALS